MNEHLDRFTATLTLTPLEAAESSRMAARHRRFMWHLAEQSPRHTVALALPAIT